eukprot:CAMPEP_0198133524 /NCGR_PEP_ID=MMETSP1442-20131203/59607_1 /TAXON_ID= /ORGANISM="Craspedostauros australis, Strain CCMP3328" /LENGTH=142 /DNA_ID=CAMNT_0043794645 /DNA_START=754 /DNA_END=1185 /DNA_ORIENTATION=-
MMMSSSSRMVLRRLQMQHGAASASAMKMAMARPFSSTQSVLMAAKSKSKSNLITKINIAEHVAAEHELSKAKSKRIVDSIVDFMTQTIVDGGTVRLTKFGSLSRKTSKARMGTNPQTMAQMKIPEKQRIKFKASGVLKEQVN